MYKESDHIHIIAMSSALGTGVRVRYMDRGAGTEVTAHDCCALIISSRSL